jgi:hypothetical protein
MPFATAAPGDLVASLDMVVAHGPPRDLLDAGPATGALLAVLGNETKTRPLAASFFWQAVLGTPAFEQILQAAGVLGRVDPYIVRHAGESRFDLVVFDDRERPQPFVHHLRLTPKELDLGWAQFASDWAKKGWDGVRSIQGLPPPYRVAAEVGQAADFFIMVAQRPPIERTAARPPSALPVNDPATPCASVGVIATSARTNQLGATTALHAASSFASLSIAGQPARIVASDAVTDSCFLECPGLQMPPVRAEGPMTGMVPRQWQPVEFDGVASGHRSTFVIASSPQLPHVFPGAQLSVLTRCDTAPGDSGAALYEPGPGGATLLGFAHYRTGYGAPNAHSSWIWAECVFLALGLR